MLLRMKTLLELSPEETGRWVKRSRRLLDSWYSELRFMPWADPEMGVAIAETEIGLLRTVLDATPREDAIGAMFGWGVFRDWALKHKKCPPLRVRPLAELYATRIVRPRIPDAIDREIMEIMGIDDVSLIPMISD